MRRLTPVLALGALLLTALPAHAADGPAHRDSYGTKAPYSPGQNPRTYQRPPAGYTPVFTENVSRHGSRTATDSEDGDLILALWDKAETEGQLTRRGEEFGPTVRALQAAMAKVGYGNLSGRGKQELKDTAVRLQQRLPSLFGTIAANGEKIDVVSSGQGRAVDSGNVFAGALADTDPALKPLIGPTRTDKDLLYFHKAAGGAAYRDYIAHDQRLADTLKSITDQPRTHEAAHSVLRRIFKDAFVDQIADQVPAAQAVYNLYAIAPAMSEESPDGQGWGMERYISRSDAAWFGYLSDAEDFYEKGPGFADSDITYKMAGVLLDDFFQQVEAKRDGTSDLGAELRFTHAEEIIPLAALMDLPGSTKPATPGEPYTYADNPWRGASVSPLGANIQWDVFQNGNRYLVRMLYNEQETPFRAGCRPIAKGSAFYDVDELERCFGRA
ncbi:histidine-type phosphatase [Streptomyces diastatochromogenes]|uniref:Multiple inositol polyphosphate phosphatase 1 n=1 Tax=Streptomyces diastatochromogenes TaxID=42236 RepID=A0A233SEF1_STRDA|nr:histidine-type phosphatase [Streptomyces diastatochromogenes]MCZ0989340.1 histidine-type phosphatase [Streptomyces diastatochromogenes]OXY94028.1 histidine acid phosphatase [Streptomyces diastatochromogenes]